MPIDGSAARMAALCAVLVLVVGALQAQEQQPRATIEIGTQGRVVDACYVRVEGTQTGVAKPMWYEVHSGSAQGKITDFGAFTNSENWFFWARHLGRGDSVVVVFGAGEDGTVSSQNVTFTVSPDDASKVNPRPRPAEVWWGGLGENQQLMDPALPWEFVKRHADAYFFHSAYWGDEQIKTIGTSLRRQLAPYATKFAVEMGGQQQVIFNEASAAGQYRGWGAPGRLGAFYRLGGLFFSEVTHDYGIGFEPAACHVLTQINPEASEQDVLDYAVDHLWRDLYFKRNYEAFGCIKAAQTTSEAWRWFDNFPQCFSDEYDFATTTAHTDGIFCPLMVDREKDKKLLIDGLDVNMRFDLRMVLQQFITMCRGIPGHTTFAFYSDFPYTHMTLHGQHSPYAVRARAMIRAVENFLHSQDAFHTFVCNDLVPPTMADAEAGHRNWCTAALRSMQLHQRGGGRADRYLFESWYSTKIAQDGEERSLRFPFWVAPEDKPWSYTNLAKQAIQYIKGIRKVDGTPQELALTLATRGAVACFTLENKGDVPCMPALVARESGDERISCIWRDQEARQISTAIRTEEGWVYTPLLQPGEKTTISCLADIPSDAGPLRIVLEAFWNPQDPTGLVRDRAVWTVGKAG